MRINWPKVLLRGTQVLVFCGGVAGFDTLIWPHTGYWFQLVYALCIGVPCWLVIEFGNLLAPGKYCVALTVAGIAVGLLGGKPLAAWLLDDISLPLRDLMLILLITIAASAIVSFYFHIRSTQAALHAGITAAERDAAQARLRLLQSQLEPHMLFNTLANLRALIDADPAAARQMLDRLDGFLRASLSASRATMHPLAGEFERLRDYLALMSIRMGPRLAYALYLPEELRTQPVPPLLLQPLVENAIKHGLEPCVKGGRIEVSAVREKQRLVLTVRDAGAGFDASQPMAEGRFGLAQVIERVTSACGDRGRVKVRSRPGKGTTIRITLPLQPDMPCPPP